MNAIGRWPDAHAASGAIAIAYHGETLSYRALARAAARLAAWIARRLPSGARIAYLGHNTPEQLVLLFACARSGRTLVPLNWRLTAHELEELIDDADPSLLVVEGHCAGLVSAAMRERCGGRVLAVRDAASGLVDLREVVDRFAADDLPFDVDAATPLLLVYTSGTTGRAKGSLLSQRALVANAANAHDMHAMTARDVVLTTLPMFHVGGLNIQTLPALALGARVLLHARFDAGDTLAAIAGARPSLTVQVPATLQALRAHPAWASTSLGSLRAIATGSTDVPIELIETIHARGVPVIQVYGATETAPIAIYQRINEAFATVGAIGRPAPGTDIRLVDAGYCDVADGNPGEILVRGAHVASGYWRDESMTATGFADGWFHSGDLATCDVNGVYWFSDRIKNVIISGGENVYPAEIERIVRHAAGIAECAVVGRPDAQWGQVPVLFAVPTTAAIDREALLALLARSLARFKHPKHIVELSALPRTALGKVDLGALRAML